jgi:cytochrome P450
MQSFFYHVLAAPRTYNAIQAEITAAVAQSQIASTGNVEWTEAQNLQYFQACLKEAMRMRPAVGVNITRFVPPEGVELEGKFFKGGTRVALNGWVLHRDKEVFGQDADFYRPERWLEDAEKARVMERYMFQVSYLFFSLLDTG